MRRLSALIACLLAGVAGCSCGCDRKASPDAFVLEARVMDAGAPDSGGDLGIGPDLVLDVLKPDLGPLPDSCGGSRTLSPQPVAPYAGKPCGKGCKQVTFGNFVEKEYEVVGDLLVYVGEAPAGFGAGFKVYLVDLKTGNEVMLQDYSKKFSGCSLVSTDGQKLAYTCVRERQLDLWPEWDRSLTVFDPKTSIETDVFCIREKLASNGCDPDYLTLGGTGIVVNGTLGACKHFTALFYRFSDGSFTNIAQKKGGVWHTHMSGTEIVWTQAELAWQASQIVLYNTRTRVKKRLAPNDGADQYLPRTDGTHVVWTDHRNGPGGRSMPGNADIYHHDLLTGKTTQVTTDPGTQEKPDVWGDWVVWQDWRNSPGGWSRGGQAPNCDIYAKNLKTGQEVQLTDYPKHEAYTRVDNDRVFYRMVDGTKWASVFMIDLKTRLGP